MPLFERAAFFDVDETLIGVKSMFDFLRYWTIRDGGDEQAYDSAMEEFHSMWAAGVHRSEVNRAYYRRFAGRPWAELLTAASAWYDEYRERDDAFVLSTVRALSGHVADGDAVVLVSGSFTGCLGPLARELGAHVVLCSEPLVDGDGLLTGEVRRPMIGDVKHQAVAETLAELKVPAADCFAYGDHSSDLAMLSLVGHPHVVGGDSVLAEHAARHNWPVLPADTGSSARLSTLTGS